MVPRPFRVILVIVMKIVAIIFGAVLGLVLLVVVLGAGSYNRLVRLSQGVDSQWAQVQNVYQRRADLVPNLVATVSGAANFEKSTPHRNHHGPRLGRAGETRPQFRAQRSRQTGRL